MKLVGLMVARNEEWVLRLSLDVALRWCDEIVFLDHGSADKTAEIADSFGDRVHRISRSDESWPEMEHRQATLEAGRDLGGTHFAVVDADELLSANWLPGIRDAVADLEPAEFLDLRMIPLWRGLEQYRTDDCVWTRGVISLAFRDANGLCWKRAADGYEHHHRMPFGTRGHQRPIDPGVLHLQWADWRRLKAKHALYKVRDLLRWPNREPVAHVERRYSEALNEQGLRVVSLPPEIVEGYDFSLVDLGQEPWHECEVKRLVELHGRGRFTGLDLLGVV